MATRYGRSSSQTSALQSPITSRTLRSHTVASIITLPSGLARQLSSSSAYAHSPTSDKDKLLQSTLTPPRTMDDEFSHSVAWETNPQPHSTTTDLSSSQADLEDVTDYSPTAPPATSNQPGPSSSSKSSQTTTVQVKDGKIELEGTKDMFVSYLVTATVSRHSNSAAS